MGILVWVASGALAFGIARIIPIGARHRWPGELIASTLTAVGFGLLATALDFGGWNEPDWRAALFALFGALAAVALTRARR